ncbi:ABC transporter substrate-binding protein [Aeromicrobium terrae]|uniref:ABC transporter substrate-binding protein n=1 Tax=Aeromicrobium terrae TaxID=2498846 RepID=A0A5C8NG15_9ACTN|nr:ABC transporter substrate-binding protein [Aeromicrobium terrae]TXL60749.1 ABC transporter substrate-binding protein [Aeromicrobium terrae]
MTFSTAGRTVRPPRVGRTARVVSTLAAGLMVSGVLAACGGSDDSSSSGGSYKIGVEIDQTGRSKASGVAQLKGMTAAADAINKAGGIDGHSVELIVRDTASDAAKAVSAYSDLKSQGVSAIAGFLGSVDLGPVVKRAKADNMALLATGSPPDLLDPKNTVFSTVANVNAQSEATLSYIKNRMDDGDVAPEGRVGILRYATPAGEQQSVALAAKAKELGIDIVTEQTAPPGAASLSSQLQTIVDKKPDAVIFLVLESDLLTAVKAADATGLPKDTPIASWAFASSPSSLALVAKSGYHDIAASANLQSPSAAEQSDGLKAYVTAAKAAGLDPGSTQIPEGYAQTMIAAAALKKCGYPCSSKDFIAALESTSTDLDGFAFGPITYSRDEHRGFTAMRFVTSTDSGGIAYAGDPIEIISK